MWHSLSISSTCTTLFTYPRAPTSTLFPYTTLFRSLSDLGESPAPKRSLNARNAHRNRESTSNPSPISQNLGPLVFWSTVRSEEHTSELQSRLHLVCRLLLEKKNLNHPQFPLYISPY